MTVQRSVAGYTPVQSAAVNSHCVSSMMSRNILVISPCGSSTQHTHTPLCHVHNRCWSLYGHNLAPLPPRGYSCTVPDTTPSPTCCSNTHSDAMPRPLLGICSASPHHVHGSCCPAQLQHKPHHHGVPSPTTSAHQHLPRYPALAACHCWPLPCCWRRHMDKTTPSGKH